MRVRRQEPAPTPEPAVSTLVVPDALIAWGREPERAMGWSRDYAREVAEFAARGREHPLSETDAECLLSRLEALAVEAVRAGRGDLLLGLDVQTAEWLGLTYEIPLDGQRVSVGRDGTLTWSEVRVLSSAYEAAIVARESGGPDPSRLARAAVRAKNLALSVFPGALIELVGPEEPDPPCASCGQPLRSVKIDALDQLYCAPCWRLKTARPDCDPPAPRTRRR